MSLEGILETMHLELLQEILALAGHEALKSVQRSCLLPVNLSLHPSHDLGGQKRKLPDECLNHY